MHHIHCWRRGGCEGCERAATAEGVVGRAAAVGGDGLQLTDISNTPDRESERCPRCWSASDSWALGFSSQPSCHDGLQVGAAAAAHACILGAMGLSSTGFS